MITSDSNIEKENIFNTKFRKWNILSELFFRITKIIIASLRSIIQLYGKKNVNVDLKLEIHVIIKFKHFHLLDFSRKKLKIKKYKTVISPVMLYGCEIRSLALREEFKLKVFEKRILRRKFSPRRVRMGNGEGSTMRNFIVFLPFT